MQASLRGVKYPRYEFLLYGWYDNQWWIGSAEEETKLLKLYNNCSIAERESVIGPALAPLADKFITNCSFTSQNGKVIKNKK